MHGSIASLRHVRKDDGVVGLGIIRHDLRVVDVIFTLECVARGWEDVNRVRVLSHISIEARNDENEPIYRKQVEVAVRRGAIGLTCRIEL